MKKISFLFTLIILVISISQAQLKPEIDRSKIKKTVPAPAPAPAPPPPPAPVNKTTAPVSTPPLIYSLTSVRVKIRTGSDNKEFPSKVYATVRTRTSPMSEGSPFFQLNLDNEMRINSDTEFGMEYGSQNRSESKLAAFQSSGLKLAVNYYPNFFADAWKIENISLVLEFKDQFGNLHPTLGNKTIAFSNAYGFLNNEYHTMECITDGSFAPLSAVIKK